MRINISQTYTGLIVEANIRIKGEKSPILQSGMCVEKKIEVCGGKNRGIEVCGNFFASPKLWLI